MDTGSEASDSDGVRSTLGVPTSPSLEMSRTLLGESKRDGSGSRPFASDAGAGVGAGAGSGPGDPASPGSAGDAGFDSGGDTPDARRRLDSLAAPVEFKPRKHRQAACSGNWQTPNDFVRDHVRNRCAMALLLLGVLCSVARLSLGSQLFVVPDVFPRPDEIDFLCPLVQPKLPSLRTFEERLKPVVMNVLFESGMLFQPWTVSWSKVSLDLLLSVLGTAVDTYEPALQHAVQSNLIPGTHAGVGKGSICDLMWLNVSSSIGAHPKVVARVVGKAGIGVNAVYAGLTVTRVTLPGEPRPVVASCRARADDAGHIVVEHLLRGFPAGIYEVTYTTEPKQYYWDWSISATLRLVVTGDRGQPAKGQLCQYTLPTMAAPDASDEAAAAPEVISPAPAPIELVVVSAPPPDEMVRSGGSMSFVVRATQAGRPVPNIPVVSWTKFDTGTQSRLTHGGVLVPRTQSMVSDDSGQVRFDYKLVFASTLAKLQMFAKVSDSTQVVSATVPTTNTTHHVTVDASQNFMPIYRIGADAPYGSELFVGPETMYHFDVLVPSQAHQAPVINVSPLSRLEFKDFRFSFEKRLAPRVCVSPPESGKRIVPLPVSISEGRQIGEVMLGISHLLGPLMSKVGINDTEAYQVLAGIVGVPKVYAAIGPDLFVAGDSLDLPYSTSHLPRLRYNETNLTGDDGCIVFHDLSFNAGPSGPIIMLFVSDTGLVGVPSFLVNPGDPIYSEMSFILERGQFDSLWIMLYLVIIITMICLGKGCCSCGLTCGVIVYILWVYSALSLFFSTNAYLLSRTGSQMYPSVGFVRSCCSFTPESMFEDVLTLGSAICLTLVAVLSVASWVRQLFCQKRRKALAAELSRFDWAQRAAEKGVAAIGSGAGAYVAPTAPVASVSVPVAGDGHASPVTEYRALNIEDARLAPEASAAALFKDGGGATSLGAPARIQEMIREGARTTAGASYRPTLWQRWLLYRGFDDYRLAEFRRVVPAFLRKRQRAVKANTSLAVALVDISKKSWAARRGTATTIIVRYLTAWKMFFVSVLNVFMAVWLVLYATIVVTIACLVKTGGIPRSHGRLCWKQCRHFCIILGEAMILTALLLWEFLVLVWAGLMDSMPFLAKPTFPHAEDDYEAADAERAHNQSLVQRFCSEFKRLFFDPATHGTVRGNRRWSRALRRKQTGVTAQLWLWISQREDLKHGGLKLSKPGRQGTSATTSVRSGGTSDVGLQDVVPPPPPEFPIFLPQRFIWAFILSNFVVLMACVSVSIIAMWLSSYVGLSRAIYHEVDAQIHLHLPLESTHTPKTRVEMALLGYILDFIRSAVGDATFQIIMAIIPVGIPGGALLTFLIIMFVWWRMAVVYKNRVRQLRRGIDTVHRRQASAVTAPFYIGYQLVHSLFGAISIGSVLFVIGLSSVLLILIKPLQGLMWQFLLDKLIYLGPSVGLFIVLRILGYFLIDTNFRMRYPVWFFWYDVISLINNCIVGMIVIMKRLAILLFGLTIDFWRLDTLSGRSVTFDSGHSAYLSMLLIDHTNNNPIKLVFLDLLKKELNVLRALRAGGLIKGSLQDEKFSVKQEDRTIWCCCVPCCCCVCTKPGYRPPPGGTNQCNVERRVKRQRNLQRWHLYIMLALNPSLMEFRKHRLRADTSYKAVRTFAEKSGRLLRLKPRGAVLPWVAEKTRVGNAANFRIKHQLVLIRDGFFLVFKHHASQAPAVAIAFESMGAVKPLRDVPAFDGCSEKHGFAIRALQQWFAFGTRTAAREEEWMGFLNDELLAVAMQDSMARD